MIGSGPALEPAPTGRFAPSEPMFGSANAAPASPAPTVPARFRSVTTEHLGQWTARSPNRIDALGFTGTDLGVSFAHRGRLWFLFGDSQSSTAYCSDSLAHTQLGPLPDQGLPQLEWVTREGGHFAPITVPNVDLGFMNVAVEGLSIDDETAYLFASTQWSDELGRHGGSALAHSQDAGLERWTLDHYVETTKFVNVSVNREGEHVYVWGSGEFRKSDVYLARVPVSAIADRDAWQYFRGFGPAGPEFGPGEDSARAVVTEGCVGELSARRHPRLGMYMLAYNCEEPRGIFLRTSDRPEGPYSDAVQLFEPWRDNGYEHFMHIAPKLSGRDDGLSDNGRDGESGGEYGPYLVPEWFTEAPDGGVYIVYTLSSWNPYQVHLMRTLLVDPASPLAPTTTDPSAPDHPSLVAANLSLRDMTSWSHAGDGFSTFESDGVMVMSSEVAPLGPAATGTLWRDFTADTTVSSLEFDVQGGDAEVLLIAGDEVVRRVTGHGQEIWWPVVFRLTSLRDRPLRVAIYDRAIDPWGFVAVRNLRLR